jgi:hypothetical protein
MAEHRATTMFHSENLSAKILILTENLMDNWLDMAENRRLVARMNVGCRLSTSWSEGWDIGAVHPATTRVMQRAVSEAC